MTAQEAINLLQKLPWDTPVTLILGHSAGTFSNPPVPCVPPTPSWAPTPWPNYPAPSIMC